MDDRKIMTSSPVRNIRRNSNISFIINQRTRTPLSIPSSFIAINKKVDFHIQYYLFFVPNRISPRAVQFSEYHLCFTNLPFESLYLTCFLPLTFTDVLLDKVNLFFLVFFSINSDLNNSIFFFSTCLISSGIFLI